MGNHDKHVVDFVQRTTTRSIVSSAFSSVSIAGVGGDAEVEVYVEGFGAAEGTAARPDLPAPLP